ncbi:hypothetical protein KI387_016523, partial [Taxus chinensis]
NIANHGNEMEQGLIIILLVIKHKTSRLPPGPTPLPIVSNLHLISELPHRSFSNLAQIYGPIMILYMGSLPAILISSSETAEKILKTHDHIFASHPLMGDDNHLLSPQKFAFSPHGPYWKLMRKIMVMELFSPKRTKSFTSMRAQEVLAMKHSILLTADTNSNSGTHPATVDVSREVSFLTNNIVCRMSFGKKCNEAELGGRVFKEVLGELIALSGGFNYRDCIPLLGRLDLKGLGIVDEHVQRRKNYNNLESEDFVDVLLSLSEDESMEFKINQNHIKNAIFELQKYTLPFIHHLVKRLEPTIHIE